MIVLCVQHSELQTLNLLRNINRQKILSIIIIIINAKNLILLSDLKLNKKIAGTVKTIFRCKVSP